MTSSSRPTGAAKPRGPIDRSRMVAALLEADKEDLVRKAIEIAKSGDAQMVRFLLDRLLPRERPLRIKLPKMDFADDAVEALGSVAQQLACGEISASEAAALATVINAYSRAVDNADLVKRMDALEQNLKGKSGT